MGGDELPIEAEPLEVLSESMELPAVTLNVNVDVNALLDDMTQPDVFDFLGKLKDLFSSEA